MILCLKKLIVSFPWRYFYINFTISPLKGLYPKHLFNLYPMDKGDLVAEVSVGTGTLASY